MKKSYIFPLIIVLMILSACEEEGVTEKLEVTEEEKAIVNMELERDDLELVFETAAKLEPIELIQISETDHYEILEAEEFEEFVPPGSWITQVSKSSNEDNNGNAIDYITIDYRLNDHRVIVEYYEDGFLRKSDLNRETGILVENNNGEYRKYYFEHFVNN